MDRIPGSPEPTQEPTVGMNAARLDQLLCAHSAYLAIFDDCEPDLRSVAFELKQLFKRKITHHLKDVQTYSYPYRWITYSNKIEIIIEEGGVWADYLEGDSVLHRIQLTTDLFTDEGRQQLINKQIAIITKKAWEEEEAVRRQLIEYHETQLAHLRDFIRSPHD